MLSVGFEFELLEGGTGQFELTLTPSGLSEPVVVTAHLPDQDATTRQEMDGPPLWSECAYKTINRAVHTVAVHVDEVLGNAQIQNLQISIKGVSKSEAQRAELSKISFKATERGGQVVIGGLIGAAVFSIETEKKDLYSVVARIFSFCGLPWTKENDTLPQPAVPVYHGDSVDDFIFVNELPACVIRWFLAFDTAFKKKLTYRDGVVVPFAAWQAFQSGEF
ncbi:MAG: hypothetical protein ACXV4B_02650 [Halobacteriota archaeon]